MRGWGHQFIYDFATLRATLEAVGFCDVVGCAVHDSPEPGLARLEGHGFDDGNEHFTRFETLVVEARQPA